MRVEEMPTDENGVRDLLQASCCLCPPQTVARGGGGLCVVHCALAAGIVWERERGCVKHYCFKYHIIARCHSPVFGSYYT